MQVIPAVDVLDGRVVRLLRGDYAAVTVYAEDPVQQARAFFAEGAELVHVVDLAGAKSGAPDVALWARMGDAGVPFQVGGGLRTSELASRALAAGAQRVVLGSAAVWNPTVLEDLVGTVGPDRVVAALDVRSGRAQGSGWTDEGRDLGEVVESVASAGCRWILATGISTDGTLEGPDHRLLARIRAAAPDLALIASGGVGDLSDIAALRHAGLDAVVVGRALYDGRFSVSEALEAAHG